MFNLKLTAKELGALISKFDKDGDHTISCPEFLVEFFRCGFAERSKRRLNVLERDRRERAKQLEAEAERERLKAEKAALKVDYDFTERDADSAIGQIEAAATLYDRNAAGTVQLDAFEGAELGPAEFREQLKRVFNIQLTPKVPAPLGFFFYVPMSCSIPLFFFFVGGWFENAPC